MPDENILVSVVVPVYNAELYLLECVNSILNQSYKNLELILINDGSTDKSSMICDDIIKADSRAHVIHQDNHGVSTARNVGIDIAQGKYVTFIDADDAIHRDFIATLFLDMESYGVSIVTTTAKDSESRNKSVLTETVKDADVFVLNVEQTMLELYKGTLEGTRNGIQMFSMKLLNSNGIRYDENMAVGEDFDFFARAILATDKIVVDRRRMYFYRSNPSSVMFQKFNIKQFEAIKNVENIGRTIEDKVPGLSKAIDTMVFSDAVFYGAKMIRDKNNWPSEYKEIVSYIHKFRFMVLTNKDAKQNTRIKALIMIIFGANLGLRLTGRLIRW